MSTLEKLGKLIIPIAVDTSMILSEYESIYETCKMTAN